MTRLAVISDIHGNLPALEAVHQDMSQFGVDQVIVAGDVVNVGPFSDQTVARVLENRWPVIRGNGEHFLLEYGTRRAPQGWNDPIEYSLLPWLSRQVSERHKRVIAAWPDSLVLRFSDAPPVRVVHGSPRSVTEGILSTTPDETVRTYLAGVNEGTVVAAHTHLPLDRTCDQWHIVNPGSVGLPRDGILTASYLLLHGSDEGWRAEFRRVPFDYAPIFGEYDRQGFVEECGVMGHLCVEALRTGRPQHSFLYWRRLRHPGRSVTVDMLDEYREECEWWTYVDPAYHVNL